MNSTQRPRVGIVGPGRLGASLAAALSRAGYRIATVGGRDLESATALAGQLGDGVLPTTVPELVLDACELVFLTVQDGAIEGLAARLPWRAHHLVVHCSGALGLDVLKGAADAGAAVGCLHPLQSFPSRHPEPDRFIDIYCGVEGYGVLGGLLEQIVGDLKARVIRLEGVDRALYHAAAVFASNYVISLASAARRVWAMAGLPSESAREALAPLLLAVARNIRETELEEAVTGPVARGDVRTIEAQLLALSPDPSLEDLYRRLGAELLRLGMPTDPMVRAGLLRRLGNAREAMPPTHSPVTIQSDRGPIHCAFHAAPGADAAVIMVGGGDGGLDGPADKLYPDLADELQALGMGVLRLDFRVHGFPGDLANGVHDVLEGVRFLIGQGYGSVGLVGHSFGGAVVIEAAACERSIASVATLATQTAGARRVGELSPRPILLIHGLADTRLSPDCSRHLHELAREPKRLVLFDGATHSLRQRREELRELLVVWFTETLG